MPAIGIPRGLRAHSLWVGGAARRRELKGEKLFYTHVILHGGPLLLFRRSCPELIVSCGR